MLQIVSFLQQVIKFTPEHIISYPKNNIYPLASLLYNLDRRAGKLVHKIIPYNDVNIPRYQTD